jgi:hypothetical protein
MAVFAAVARGVSAASKVSRLMSSRMGDAGTGQATEQLKKIQEIRKKLESGELNIQAIKHLDADFLHQLGGEGFLEKFGGGRFGKKSFNPYREMVNEQERQGIDYKEKNLDDKRSLKSFNGSLHVTESTTRLNNEIGKLAKHHDSGVTFGENEGAGFKDLNLKIREEHEKNFINDLKEHQNIAKT